MSENKRIRRTPQQIAEDFEDQIKKLEQSISGIENKKRAIVADCDRKIEAVHGRIKVLEEKKAAILAPRKTTRKPRKSKKQKLEAILKQASKSGLKPEEIAMKLGLDVGE